MKEKFLPQNGLEKMNQDQSSEVKNSENLEKKVQEKKGIEKVIVERGVVIPFEKLPPKSIALDGYVEGPAIDVEGERFSFDHHAGCIRLFTRSTAQQVMDALLLGFEPKDFTAYINDVDGDTTLAVWLLKNPEAVNNKFVRELVESVGPIDSHGPSYPPLNEQLVNVFYYGVMKPVVDLQRARKYGEANLEELLAVCLENIDKLIEGKFDYRLQEEKEPNFEITHQGDGWIMAKSDGYIFNILYEKGYKRIVAYQEQSDGSIAYTIGKKSDLVKDFPIGPHNKPGTILYALNQREPGWGGGSTIGGAPRNSDGSRSRLAPDDVFQIVEKVVKSVKNKK